MTVLVTRTFDKKTENGTCDTVKINKDRIIENRKG